MNSSTALFLKVPLPIFLGNHLRRRPRLRILLLLAFLWVILPAEVLPGSFPRRVIASRAAHAPTLDGVLDEEVWQTAAPATGFLQRDPYDGEPATEQTEIRVLYDQEALYFGCMFFDSSPRDIVSRLARRDEDSESDMGSIQIDSYHDARTAYRFAFSVSGVKVDMIQYDDGDREDASWDAVWDLETQVTTEGWSAEVRIPFSVLRYHASDPDGNEQVWGINFARYVSRKKEESRWAHTPKSESGVVSRFGHLHGLRHLPTPHRVELLPFGVFRRSWIPSAAGMGRTASGTLDGGLDLKIGITNSLTVDATVNPDFGQVEADPAVLNLSTFETFYPEKRPFFIEGMQIIRFPTFGDGGGGPGMFYSRRIGRGISPEEIDMAPGEQVEQLPSHVSILGAAKLSGRVTRDLSIGILQAVTKREYATLRGADAAAREPVIEPEAHFSVLRARFDVLTGSALGGILTSVARRGRAPAMTAGVDWDLRLLEATHRLDGFLALSHTMDGDQRRVNGSAGRVQFARLAAVHWLWAASLDFTTPRYDINDAGFFRRPNDYGGFASLTYKEETPAALVRRYALGATFHERWNFDRANINRDFSLRAEVLFTNYWQLSADGSLDVGKYDDRETRGNGLYGTPAGGRVSVEVETDTRAVVAAELEQEWEWDERHKHQYTIGASLQFRPLSYMVWRMEAELETVRNEEAWAANITTGGRTVSVFGDRSTDLASLTLRGEIVFTRDLTLQLYGQLFLAKGMYASFRSMEGPGVFSPWQGVHPSVDFNGQQLHTNAVVRWEYVPGSTLYLVWSQAREGGHGNASTTIQDDLHAVFRTPPSNVILLKVSYWWSP